MVRGAPAVFADAPAVPDDQAFDAFQLVGDFEHELHETAVHDEVRRLGEVDRVG